MYYVPPVGHCHKPQSPGKVFIRRVQDRGYNQLGHFLSNTVGIDRTELTKPHQKGYTLP